MPSVEREKILRTAPSVGYMDIMYPHALDTKITKRFSLRTKIEKTAIFV